MYQQQPPTFVIDAVYVGKKSPETGEEIRQMSVEKPANLSSALAAISRTRS
jgi:hypothetical protein